MKCNLFALMIPFLCTSVHAQTSATYDDRHRISVSGDAVVNVAPDLILVTFGIETRDLALLVAKQQNDTIAKAALAAIKRMGIADSDIQTDHLSITQRFDEDRRFEESRFLGYIVRNMFVVTLKDPSKIEGVITTALAAGVNHLLNVDFQTAELKRYREQARELAVRAAREKADKMAATLGQTVGNPIQIDEDQRYVAPLLYSSWSGAAWGSNASRNAVASQVVSQAGAGEAADTMVLGKVAVRATVRIVFELEH